MAYARISPAEARRRYNHGLSVCIAPDGISVNSRFFNCFQLMKTDNSFDKWIDVLKIPLAFYVAE